MMHQSPTFHNHGKNFNNSSPFTSEQQSTLQTPSSSFSFQQYLHECVWPGLGLFGESYLLFSIGILKPVWEMIYPTCFVTMQECTPSLIYGLTYSVVLGVILGMIVLGTLANEIGRRKGSLITAFLMSVSSFCMMLLTMIFSHAQPDFLFGGMVICLFVFGIGVGGEYPLSASSASERSMEQMRNRMMEAMKAESRKKQSQEHFIESSKSDETEQAGNISNILRERNRDDTRGRTILLLFSMQGVGIFFNTLTITLLLFMTNQLGQDGDLDGMDGNLGGLYDSNVLLYIWRFVYFFATFVLLYVLYSRYLYLEESSVWEQYHDSKKISESMDTDDINGLSPPSTNGETMEKGGTPYYAGIVFEADLNEQSNHIQKGSKYRNYLLLMKHYWHRLFGTSMAWLLWDIAFYGNKLHQSKFLLALTGEDTTLIELTTAATFNSLIALLGYFAAAFLVDKSYVGRYRLQTCGFLISSTLFIICGLTHDRMPSSGLVVLYFASSFFGQCGPNSTTFLIPAEIFPTEMRTMCHGISAALGKVGALLAAILFNYTNDVQIFLISGYTSLLACLITVVFIPESVNLDLFELDRKWHMIIHDTGAEYRGPASYPYFCSFYERQFPM